MLFLGVLLDDGASKKFLTPTVGAAHGVARHPTSGSSLPQGERH
jgi:hypothetical protein